MKVSSIFILSFLCLILVVPLTSAEVEDAVQRSFQFNTQFDLKRPCFNNGTFCSGSAICNITLIYPDGTLLKNNQRMTVFTSYSNITISQPLNNQLGFIDVISTCTDSGGAINANAGDTFKIAITGDGKPPQDFPTQFSIIALGFILIGVGLFQERLRMFKHAGAILTMIMGILTLYPGYSFINYSTLLGLGLGTIFIGLGFYFLIEDSFSRNLQDDTFDQPQTEESEQ